MKLVFKYAFFACISTGFNLVFQYLSFLVYDAAGALYCAMFLGTLAGLIVKYILDKKFIFYHVPENKKDDANKFAIYTIMGVLTTIIFWGTEIIFDAVYQSTHAKYIGAAIGLSIGYVIKYFLDKKYVFIHHKVERK